MAHRFGTGMKRTDLVNNLIKGDSMVDYSVLEGREVKFVDINNKYNMHNKIGIVVGCDRDIGITIINKHNNKDYLLCHPGPSSHLIVKQQHLAEPSVVAFNYIITLIRDGVIDIDVLVEYLENNVDGWGVSTGASQETCSFY